jgi:hypothetical protein
MERIREIRPNQLFIIADGPRPHKPGEDALCHQTRTTVEKALDWPCEVERDYAQENMGCGKRLPSGLSHMFRKVDRAIVLEDDVVPHPSFFPFASTMLDQYADTPEVMQIGAYNRFQYSPDKHTDYFFSRFSDIWGWATWKRAWDRYDEFDGSAWQNVRDTPTFKSKCYSTREEEMRRYCLDQIFSGQLSAWGMRWDTTKLLNNGLGVVPAKNLSLNIGFGSEASHTINPFNPHRFMRVHGIEAPYAGPDHITSDADFDRKYNKKMFPKNVMTEKLRTNILNLLGKK